MSEGVLVTINVTGILVWGGLPPDVSRVMLPV
jgi:hypothetical protein